MIAYRLGDQGEAEAPAEGSAPQPEARPAAAAAKPSAPAAPAQTALPADLTEGVGRNDPCPCGSGKKFKKCHG